MLGLSGFSFDSTNTTTAQKRPFNQTSGRQSFGGGGWKCLFIFQTLHSLTVEKIPVVQSTRFSKYQKFKTVKKLWIKDLNFFKGTLTGRASVAPPRERVPNPLLPVTTGLVMESVKRLTDENERNNTNSKKPTIYGLNEFKLVSVFSSVVCIFSTRNEWRR
jgi:hypothetical protein